MCENTTSTILLDRRLFHYSRFRGVNRAEKAVGNIRMAAISSRLGEQILCGVVSQSVPLRPKNETKNSEPLGCLSIIPFAFDRCLGEFCFQI